MALSQYHNKKIKSGKFEHCEVCKSYNTFNTDNNNTSRCNTRHLPARLRCFLTFLKSFFLCLFICKLPGGRLDSDDAVVVRPLPETLAADLDLVLMAVLPISTFIFGFIHKTQIPLIITIICFAILIINTNRLFCDELPGGKQVQEVEDSERKTNAHISVTQLPRTHKKQPCNNILISSCTLLVLLYRSEVNCLR